MYSKHDRIKLEIKGTEKSSNIWRLSCTILDMHTIKRTIAGEIRKYFQLIENKIKMYQNVLAPIKQFLDMLNFGTKKDLYSII